MAKKYLPIIIYLALALAQPAAAFTINLLPCKGLQCNNICQLFQMGERVLDLLFFALFPIVTIMVVWGGFEMMIFGGSNSGKVAEAKGRIRAAIVGLVIAFTAWLLIDTILKILAPTLHGGTLFEKLGPWHEINCQVNL